MVLTGRDLEPPISGLLCNTLWMEFHDRVCSGWSADSGMAVVGRPSHQCQDDGGCMEDWCESEEE